jgi:peptidoglycan-N-acetylglucosamine deacetylase
MKRFVEIIGIIFLICFSFMYTDKSIMVIREQDPLMQKIIDNQDKYNQISEDVKIVNKIDIIPGYNGLVVDTYRSYSNMKKVGNYNPSLLIYKKEIPKLSVNKIYDKYVIGGNANKNSVSIIFKVGNSVSNEYLKQIKNILIKNKIKATFFIDSKWLEDNIDELISLSRNDNEIANLGYNNSYSKDNLVWNNNLIESIINKKVKYCYTEIIDNNILDLCSYYKMHTIKPNIIVNNYPFNTIKNNVTAGSIISLNINKEVINELNTIINYLKSKGYNINILREHLSEER